MQFILLPPCPLLPLPPSAELSRQILTTGEDSTLTEMKSASDPSVVPLGADAEVRDEKERNLTLVCKEQKMNVLFLLLSFSSLHSQPGNTELQL